MFQSSAEPMNRPLPRITETAAAHDSRIWIRESRSPREGQARNIYLFSEPSEIGEGMGAAANLRISRPLVHCITGSTRRFGASLEVSGDNSGGMSSFTTSLKERNGISLYFAGSHTHISPSPRLDQA